MKTVNEIKIAVEVHDDLWTEVDDKILENLNDATNVMVGGFINELQSLLRMRLHKVPKGHLLYVNEKDT
jgi:hypothetical protein